ncbi:hypothetical protein V1264_006265 [Littorina saxatilis]|uniref:Sodium-coupled monocarboxylate transporter 1 n=1 Tax=Littorina saxatilis TaxID=31220 RepID=A0AAN9G4Q9_9CAEN
MCRALLVSLPATVVLVSLVCLSGLVIYVTYHTCDPLTSGNLMSQDQILPYFVMDQLGSMSGAPGLFVSCIFAASLSSVSSVLNALSISVLEDLIKPIMTSRGSSLSPAAEANVAKMLGLVGGMAVIGLAFLSALLGNTVLEIMITALGMGGGPLLALFIMGMFVPCVNSVGALAGFVVSTFVTFWVAIGSIVLHVPHQVLPLTTTGCAASDRNVSRLFDHYYRIDDMLHEATVRTATAAMTVEDSSSDWTGLSRIYTLSFLWYPTLAVNVALIVAIPVSALSVCLGGRRDTLNPKLVYNVGDHCCRWLTRLMGCTQVWKYKVRGAGDFPCTEDSEGNDDFYIDESDMQPLVCPRDKAASDGFLRDTDPCFRSAVDSSKL